MAEKIRDNYPLVFIAAELKDGKVVPGTVQPFRYRNLAMSGADAQADAIQENKTYGKGGLKSFYRTDSFGRICVICTDRDEISSYRYAMPNIKMEAYLLSNQFTTAALYLTPDTPTENWKENTRILLEKELTFDEKVVLKTVQFTGDDISKKVYDILSEKEQSEFKEIFKSGQKYVGLCVPVLRHLVIIPAENTNRERIISSNAEIKSKSIKELSLDFHLQNKGQVETCRKTCTIISLPASELPDGIYTATFSDASGNPRFTDHTTGKQSAEYSISFKVSFDMNTPIGAIDIVNGAPITLEETLLMHYPSEYAHLTSALMSIYQGGDSYSESAGPFNSAKSALQQATDCAKILKEKHDFISDRSEFEMKNVFDDAFAVIGNECPEIQSAYKLYLSYGKCKKTIKDVFDVWKLNTRIVKLVDPRDQLSVLSKLYYCVAGKNILDKYGKEVFEHLLSRDVGSKKYALHLLASNDSTAKYNFLVNTDGPWDKYLDAQKSKFAKALTSLELVFSAYDTITAFSSLWTLCASSKEEQQKYNRIIKEYADLKLAAPSRESAATMVKSRIGVDKLAQNVNSEMIKAVWSAFDTLCSIGALTPAAPVFGAAKFVKDAAGTFHLTFVNTANMLEDKFPDNLLSQMWHRHKISVNLRADLQTNVTMLTNKNAYALLDTPESKDVFIQARIAAEVMRSLMSLIQQISCKVYNKSAPVLNPITGEKEFSIDYSKFDVKVVQLEIEEFVKRFVFDTGWLFPQKMDIPVGLDEIWHYMRWEGRAKTYDAACTNQNTADDVVHMDSPYFGVKPADPAKLMGTHWKADFHKYFPVHCMQSDSVKTLAHIFSQNYAGASKFIRWTQIYCRETLDNSSNKINWPSINDGWTPLSDYVAKVQTVTTNLQFRVIVAFDGGVDIRAVPMSLKLYRVEFLTDIPGPEYKFVPSILSNKDGTLLPGEENFEGKLGSVFFPFYMFGGQIQYGIRPFEDGNSVWGQITQALWKKTMEEPNHFGFTLKIGDSKVPVFYGKTPVDYGNENPANHYLPALGKHTFLFKLDRRRKMDAIMFRNPEFLNTKDSINEKMPSLMGKLGRRGIAGVYFHSDTKGEYVSAGTWKNVNGTPVITMHKDVYHVPSSFCSPNSVRFTVVLYITVVNDVAFVKNKEYIHTWTATPCSLGISELLLGIDNPMGNSAKQIVPGTLHFLGYATKVKDGTNNGFQLRKIRTSVDVENVAVDMNKNKIELIQETPEFNDDLKALLQWGKNNSNFEKNLFADPGGFWESAFFAAEFDLFWDDKGVEKKGFHKDFKSADTLELQMQIVGEEKPFALDRKIKVAKSADFAGSSGTA